MEGNDPNVESIQDALDSPLLLLRHKHPHTLNITVPLFIPVKKRNPILPKTFGPSCAFQQNDNVFRYLLRFLAFFNTSAQQASSCALVVITVIQ